MIHHVIKHFINTYEAPHKYFITIYEIFNTKGLFSFFKCYYFKNKPKLKDFNHEPTS